MQTEHKHSQPGRLQVNLVVVGRGAESDQLWKWGYFSFAGNPKEKETIQELKAVVVPLYVL